ncbi:vacuolar ATPase assembly integral membrane protein VMA21 [Ascobolus immersus RN42]|uniref:Vacuolar ATPase assembly integral membrane protein VMA21 n=1 Tax=Ascobolus immersus RN42 TaxID=1160509 RepID=A0A3N4I5M3_ASCIM|nr:vacuolar ATPase assembly integral membrane protein VMA21 [Ascobolus immersus RN42]
MATRRTVSSKSVSPKDELPSSPKPKQFAPNQTTVPKGVLFKLLFFTAMMIVAPLASYFLTIDNVFNGNATYSGATAAVVANVVLIGYVIVAFQEESAEDSKKKR